MASPETESASVQGFSLDRESAHAPGDLGTVRDDLATYNNRFSLEEFIEYDVDGSFNGQAPADPSAQAEREFHELLVKHEGLLATTGLEIAPVSHVLVVHERETAHVPQLTIDVTDRGRFISYLGSLDAQTLTESQAEGLAAVAERLTAQLVDQVETHDAQDSESADLLGSIETIVSEYRRLGTGTQPDVAASVTKLALYAEQAKAQQLREYLLIERGDYLADIGDESGPSGWHLESTPHEYEGFWLKAIDALLQVGAHPQAAALATQLRARLQESLRYARAELQRAEASQVSGSPESEKLQVLDRIEPTLTSPSPATSPRT